MKVVLEVVGLTSFLTLPQDPVFCCLSVFSTRLRTLHVLFSGRNVDRDLVKAHYRTHSAPYSCGHCGQASKWKHVLQVGTSSLGSEAWVRARARPSVERLGVYWA